MDISDAEQNVILRGIQLVPLFGLLEQYALDKPRGEFILLPIEDKTIAKSSILNPRRVDQTHTLLYIDQDDVEIL